EGVADVLHGAVVALGHGVDLGAMARRENHDLSHVLARGDVRQHLGQPGRRHVHPLEHLERNGAMAQSDGDDRHACRRSPAWATWPCRMRSSMSEFSAFYQSSPSVERPAARTASRSVASKSRMTSYSGPSDEASRVFSQDAKAGLLPPVDT